MQKECSNCHITLDEDEIVSKYNNVCPVCHLENSYEYEYIMDIKRISTDESFVQAMIKLYNENPIEYQLKIQQFKTQLQQQKSIQQTIEQKSTTNDTPKLTCPKCGSTNITEGTKGFSLMTGFIGSGNFRYVCKRCGNKWKPGSMLEILQRANNKT